MEITNQRSETVSSTIITPQSTSSVENLSADVMMQAFMIEEVNKKIDEVKTKLEMKTALLGAYGKQIGKLDMVRDKHPGGGDTKIYHTYERVDFTYDEKSGEVKEIKRGQLATKDPIFGAKYTPKAALSAEIERLKKTEDKLKKEVSQLETDLKELLTRKKAMLEEVASGVTKKGNALKDLSMRT
ncbi:MAG: hypothetical protein HY541_05925 [Deltaproteobacteria bacterium]|nr:hypothetical protein [Deltaproteobacteria bacterium]MBI4412002.1 hypothetical protein [Deltaproteobacteria bacterium]